MKIHDLRLFGIRCFEDSGDIQFHPKFNVFVGKNNAGKSTILKAILGLQGFPFGHLDVRPGHQTSSFISYHFNKILQSDVMHIGRAPDLGSMRVTFIYHGNMPNYSDTPHNQFGVNQPLFVATRPHHAIVPFIAKRKATAFSHDISLGNQWHTFFALQQNRFARNKRSPRP